MDYDRLRELQEKFEENPRRYFAPLANEYRKGGQHKRAIEICRAHLAQMPGHMSGQIVFGQALFEAGDWDEARAVFGRALALDPENLIALRSLGDMSLQAGNTAEARTWYMRLLDADPKDTAVIALVSEINASTQAAASPPPEAAAPEMAPPEAAATEMAPPEAAAPEMEAPEAAAPEMEAPEAAAPETAFSASAESATEPATEPATEVDAQSSAFEQRSDDGDEPLGLERHYPAESVNESGSAQPEVDERTEPMAGIASSRQDDADALESWVLPPGAAINERAPSAAELELPPAEPAAAGEDTSFTGASAEPFVNETMAQLYLQQGYLQLALKVYRQLSASRPHDQALKDRIAEIEAADAVGHPGEAPAMRRDEPSIERPAQPASPRSPSIESPAPWTQPESEESPGLDRSPIDSPPAGPPSRDRESIESPARDEPREPESIAARQPSIREFFATLGRRRPPRASGSQPVRSGNSMPSDTGAPLSNSAPGASLDAVFAGATVSPSDARAASRLAGAFSGGTGASRTPPTPPMPTPRVNPRMPQVQESEEDVAKFRAWLDGLTRE